MKQATQIAMYAAIGWAVWSCSSKTDSTAVAKPTEVIDLDKVLAAFEVAASGGEEAKADPQPSAEGAAAEPGKTAGAQPEKVAVAEPAKAGAQPENVAAEAGKAPAEGAAPTEGAAPAEGAAPTKAVAAEPGPAPVEVDDAAKNEAFLKRFAEALNQGHITARKLGVAFREDGAISGFHDVDGNMVREQKEEELFWVEVDPEQGRVIASTRADGETYHRPHHYHRSGGGGFLMGYLVGRMMFRQNMYYAQPGRARPSYRNMKMNSKNYRSTAQSRSNQRAAARNKARSARSSGGSRSFRGGK